MVGCGVVLVCIGSGFLVGVVLYFRYIRLLGCSGWLLV